MSDLIAPLKYLAALVVVWLVLARPLYGRMRREGRSVSAAAAASLALAVLFFLVIRLGHFAAGLLGG